MTSLIETGQPLTLFLDFNFETAYPYFTNYWFLEEEVEEELSE